MVRAIAKQAEAERDRRAKIIHAEAEFQASQTLVDAANILASSPAAMQLRYLQTLTEIGAEQNSTVVFPMPIDIVKPFLDMFDKPGKMAIGTNGTNRGPIKTGTPGRLSLDGRRRSFMMVVIIKIDGDALAMDWHRVTACVSSLWVPGVHRRWPGQAAKAKACRPTCLLR